MKELTLEEKAKAYDKALERAKKLYEQGTITESLSYVFPELKESEDELKWLKQFIQEEAYSLSLDIRDNEDRIKFKNLQKSIAWLEKQGEHKPTDKVEPKFHEGDWITKGDYTWKIVEVKPLDYILQSQDGNMVDDTISHVDNNFHLWTIQDAKAGDVLASEDGNDILIFRNFDTSINFSSYYNLRGRGELGWSNTSFIPATKERRETLLKAMADDGYTFDFEKKKLKKIEAKPDMIQWRGDNLKEIIEFTGKDKNFDKWFKSFAEYEKYVSEHDNVFKLFNADGSHFEVPVGAWIVKTPDGYNVASKAIFKNKPAEWSKENKAMLDEIIDFFENGTVKLQHDLSLYASWLKSLRPQKQWKPSEDQMKALNYVVNLMASSESPKENDYYYNVFKDLRKQLKKLMEE